MTADDARDRAKKRLGIDASITTFDNDLEEFAEDGIDKFYPYAQREIDPQDSNLTVSNNSAVVDLSGLSTPCDGARMIEVSDGSGIFQDVEYIQHGTKIKITDISSSNTTARIYGLGRFDLATCPKELELAVVYFLMSEFYTMLVGNKRKYNVYMQNGRSATENMNDLSEYYEQKAITHLNDRATLYGQ